MHERADRQARRRFSAEDRRRIVTDFNRSGLSQCRFAAKQGIAQGVLSRWLSEFAAGRDVRESAPSLVPVRIVDDEGESSQPTSSTSDHIEILTSRDVTIRVPPGFDRAALADVLSIVERRGC
jgi:transposase-like protein